MDNTKTVNAVEWFTGYAGNSLGLRRVIPNLRDIAFCEREAFACANLVIKMEAGLLDAVPIWTDCTTFPCDEFYGKVDLFIASYPCQPFSAAGQRKGADDERHLWPAVRRFVQRARPRCCFFENVEGHVTLGLNTVISDLEEDGYRTAWGIFSAAEVGAPHQRKRVFIMALRRSEGRIGRGLQDRGEGRSVQEPAQSQRPEQPLVRSEIKRCGECPDVAHRSEPGPQGHTGDVNGQGREPGGQVGPSVWPAGPGPHQHGWEPPRVTGNLDDAECGAVRADLGPGHIQDNKPERPDGSRIETDGEAEQPLGGNADGPTDGLDIPGLPGLRDSELAEIRQWMEKVTNRIDELRMCGNGVVPQTAAKAWAVLSQELGINREEGR